MKKLKNLLNHERYQAIAIAVILALLVWFYGCESKVASLSDPAKQVTRAELKIELDTILASAEHRYSQLDKQDALRQAIVEHALIVGQTGALNPYGLIALVAGALGVGATVDNVRKRAEIKNLKNE